MAPLNFDSILLEKEQEDLLIALVEAARRQPRNERNKFMVSMSLTTTDIIGLEDFPHPYKGDVETLARSGLLNASNTSKGTLTFDVAPLGFRYYEHLMKSRGSAAERVETNVMGYLGTSGFQQRHPEAFAKWQQAEELLWSSNSEMQHTAVGHHCREAMQLFATSLVNRYQLPEVESDPAKTVSRLRAVLNQAKLVASAGIIEMLDALVVYWGTTSDLAQRQGHGGQKEGAVLTREDSRRLVFHSAIVMIEFDRVLKSLSR